MIGVFDSGVGGLTVLRAIHQWMPSRGTAYLGDTARVPYGTRSKETVIRYAIHAAKFLAERESLSILVVACNTASAVAIDALRAVIDVPVIGVIEPTAKRAVKQSKAGRIGVIGTPGTIDSGAYRRAVLSLHPEAQIFSRACPLFVPLAEEGWTDPEDPITLQIAERYLAPFLGDSIDTLILGCTHYPLLEAAIGKVLGPSIVLADAADAVGEATSAIVGGGTASGTATPTPVRRYYVTDMPRGFRTVAERFLGGAIEAPIEVDL